MSVRIDFLYRGPLSSCNYDCHYCPFAKRKSSRAELAEDRKALCRFVGWIEAAQRPVGILFTPWGESLVRGHYRDAMVHLSRLPHVEKVAVQTNLSVELDWLRHAQTNRVGLWATYHPGLTPHRRFLAKVERAHAMGMSISVGIVGLPEHLSHAERLRAELPGDVYLWVNAAKSQISALPSLAEAFTRIDPLYPLNSASHASRGHRCRTGERVVSVDGRGDVRRCHFVPEVLGNLHETPLEAMLRERPCPNERCGCHIGYVHLEHLGLEDTFGSHILERVPARGRRHLAVI